MPVDAARQQQILDHHLRAPRVEALEQLLAARRRANDAQIGERFEPGLEAARDNAVVVHDGNPDHARCPWDLVLR